MQQRAMSAVISTVLMVGVSVVVSGLLFVFSGSFAREQISGISSGAQIGSSCSFIGLKIDDTTDSATAVTFDNNNNRLTFKLSNVGSVNITDRMTLTVAALTLGAYGASQVLVEANFEEDIPKGGFTLVTLTDTSTDPDLTSATTLSQLASVDSVRVTPTLCPSNFNETATIVNS